MILSDKKHRDDKNKPIAYGCLGIFIGMLLLGFVLLCSGVIHVPWPWKRTYVAWELTISEEAVAKIRTARNDESLKLDQQELFAKCSLATYGFRSDTILLTTAKALDNAQSNAEKQRREQILGALTKVYGEELYPSFVLQSESDRNSDGNAREDEAPKPSDKVKVPSRLMIQLTYQPNPIPKAPENYPPNTFDNLVVKPSGQAVQNRKSVIETSLVATRETGVALREEGYDVVLQDLLRAEMARPSYAGVDFGAWLGSIGKEPFTVEKLKNLPILGAKNEDSAKAFRAKFYKLNDMDYYHRSYCYWINSLVHHNLGQRSAADWRVALDKLIKVAKLYETAAGDLTDVKLEALRVDGSILTLALYAAVALRLEEHHVNPIDGSTPLRVALSDEKRFATLADHLIKTAHRLEPNLVNGFIDPRRPEFTSYCTPDNLVGGKFLYFTLRALVAMDEGKMPEAQENMKHALTLKNVFVENRKKSPITPYAYCYLMRSAVANARVCAKLHLHDEEGSPRFEELDMVNDKGDKVKAKVRVLADSWTKEWLDFADLIDTLCPQPNPKVPATNYGGGWSNYYWHLGQLAYINGMTDQREQWAGDRPKGYQIAK